MRYAWVVLGVVAARFLSTAIAFPSGDGDLWWQRWLGATILSTGRIPRALGPEAFAAVGAPWTPQEWLFSILARQAGDNGLGWDLFAGAVALTALAALALAAYAAVIQGASPRAVALCLTFGALALFESFGVRVQVVAWLMLALYLLFLNMEDRRAYLAIAVAALWSNLHGSAMLAPVIATVAALASFADRQETATSRRRLATIAILSAVAICANPFGWDLPRYALMLFSSPIKAYISEWKPTDLLDSAFSSGALPLLLLALVSFGAKRPRLRDWAVLAAFAWLQFSAARNVALFGIAGIVYVAPALTRAFPFFAPPPPEDPRTARRVNLFFAAFSLTLALVVSYGLLTSTERNQENVARAAVASIATLPGQRRIYCADFAWCSLAIGTKNATLFLDGRADPYPDDVWNDYVALTRGSPGWNQILARRRIDTLVVRKDSAINRIVELDHGWKTSFEDPTYRVWTRP